MKPIVEKQFQVDNFDCVILLQPLGHRTAYVNVIDTELQFVDYNEIDLDVHGGLTYSSETLYGNENGWWIGWDYAHYMDASDYPALVMYANNYEDAKLVAKRISMDGRFGITADGHVWALDEVEAEVREAVSELVRYLKHED